eukprot:1207267-Pleurochrysis_carterae.AAC.2
MQHLYSVAKHVKRGHGNKSNVSYQARPNPAFTCSYDGARQQHALRHMTVVSLASKCAWKQARRCHTAKPANTPQANTPTHCDRGTPCSSACPLGACSRRRRPTNAMAQAQGGRRWTHLHNRAARRHDVGHKKVAQSKQLCCIYAAESKAKQKALARYSPGAESTNKV